MTKQPILNQLVNDKDYSVAFLAHRALKESIEGFTGLNSEDLLNSIVGAHLIDQGYTVTQCITGIGFQSKQWPTRLDGCAYIEEGLLIVMI
jgi:hypothetical protein